MQNHYSLLTRDPEHDGVLDACARHSIAFVPYFPLESGVLTGKYRPGEALPEGPVCRWGERAKTSSTTTSSPRVAGSTEWAGAKGHTLLELAMSWLVVQRAGRQRDRRATKPEQVRDQRRAAGWAMSTQDLADLAAARAG